MDSKENTFLGTPKKTTYVPMLSSIIKKMTYDFIMSELTIEFKNGGGAYVYHGVPEDVWTNLLTKDSKGSAFHSEIKGKYKTTKIQAP